MNMKKKAAAACVAVMAAVSLPMGIVPVQPVQADLITDVIGGLQVKSALSKQIKHYDTTKEGQNEIYQAVTKRTGVLDNEYYNERLASIMNRLSHSIAQTDSSIKTLPYRWYVSPDKTFNAACTMGHVMIVNKGMFDLVSNDDEIAVVLGHEMGHGQKHHVAAPSAVAAVRAARGHVFFPVEGHAAVAAVAGLHPDIDNIYKKRHRSSFPPRQLAAQVSLHKCSFKGHRPHSGPRA